MSNHDLSKIAIELSDLAAQLSVFKPVLVEITDHAKLSAPVYGQLEMVASLSEYINNELCDISERLKVGAA